jgi:hypothetical protein
MALLAHHRVATRKREHDLPADAGGVLAAAVGENDDAEPLARDHADIGRGVVEPAVGGRCRSSSTASVSPTRAASRLEWRAMTPRRAGPPVDATGRT